MDPIQFLLENKETVLKAYEAGKGPKGAWNILCEQLPELTDAMRYNSFKQYSTPFVKIYHVVSVQNEALKVENETLKAENERLKSKAETTKKEAGKIAQKDAQKQTSNSDNQLQVKDHSTKNIIGWTIVRRKPKNPKHAAVYDAKRRISGKSISVYIGKNLDVDLAVKKIRKKERELKKAGIKLSSLQKEKAEKMI